MQLDTPLTVKEIEFRIQSINKGGYATILVYKNARVDMQRLDDVYGCLGWQRKHSNDNKNCAVSVWCVGKNEWISKEDVGTESNVDKEKGLASDSFKRSCFNWGIGRELYDYPVISIKLSPGEGDNPQYGEWYLQSGKPKAGWGLKLKEWSWYSEFEGKKISFLAARDEKGKTRWKWGTMKGENNV